MSKAATMKVPESGVLRACCDLLTAERIWWMRMNSTGTRVVLYETKKGPRRGVIRGLKKGTADILALPRSLRIPGSGVTPWTRWIDGAPAVVWIETKGSSGQSPEQKEFQKEAEENGQIYLLIRDAVELQDWLKKNK